MKRNILFFCFIFFALTIKAQYAVGDWVPHNAYNGVSLVEEGRNVVYCVSNGSLFSYDKEDNSIEIGRAHV